MKRVVIGLCLILLLTLPSFAASDSDLTQMGQSGFGVEELDDQVPQEAQEFSEEYGLGELSAQELMSLSPSQLFKAIQHAAWDTFAEIKSGLFSMLGVVLLCAMLNCIQAGKGEGAVTSVFEMVCVLAVTAALSTPVVNCIEMAASSIVDSSLFLLSYVPVFTAVVAASGMPLSAAAYQATIIGAGEVIAQFSSGLLIPLMGIYLAFCMVGGLSKSGGLIGIANAVKTVVTWTLSFGMTAFVGLLTLQSFMASAGDGAATKTARFLIGTFVPVVGSAISDALGAAQGSIRLIKASVGGFGIAVAAFTFLPVLLRVCIWRLVIAAASAAGEVLGTSQIKGVLKAFSNVLTVLTAMILSIALLLVISTAVMLSLGGTG